MRDVAVCIPFDSATLRFANKSTEVWYHNHLVASLSLVRYLTWSDKLLLKVNIGCLIYISAWFFFLQVWESQLDRVRCPLVCLMSHQEA